MLNRSHDHPIASWSKASRGLFVQLWVTRIFTGLAISPGPSLRQFSSRDAIRARRNSPDKEFRYLRTIIVIAGVHQRLGSKLPLLRSSLRSELRMASPSSRDLSFRSSLRSKERRRMTSPRNVLTLARHQPLYIAFRLRRDLCFW